MNKIKKYVIIGILVLVLVIILYFVLVSYLVTGGFRDYKSFCAGYIPQIDAYYARNHRYPDDLFSLSLPDSPDSYDPAQCGYSVTGQGYVITAPAGLAGQVVYSSETGLWAVE